MLDEDELCHAWLRARHSIDHALCVAVSRGRAPEAPPAAVAATLISAGADVHAFYGKALRLAAAKGHEALVDLLLAAGANVNTLNPDCWTECPLNQAAQNGHADVVSKLLAAGALGGDAAFGGIASEAGDMALYLAAEHGHCIVVEVLLRLATHATNIFINVGMSTAAENGRLAVVEQLLAAGAPEAPLADVHAYGDIALRAAAVKGHPTVVSLLLAAGAPEAPLADVHARQDYALRGAAFNGHPTVVSLLLAAGAPEAPLADVHARHDEALSCAARNFHHDVVEQLRAAGAVADLLTPPLAALPAKLATTVFVVWGRLSNFIRPFGVPRQSINPAQ
jgi:ankyrin repeat protein